jgi:hypothetical protein
LLPFALPSSYSPIETSNHQLLTINDRPSAQQVLQLLTAHSHQQFLSLTDELNRQLNLLSHETDVTIKKWCKAEKVDFEAVKTLITNQQSKIENFELLLSQFCYKMCNQIQEAFKIEGRIITNDSNDQFKNLLTVLSDVHLKIVRADDEGRCNSQKFDQKLNSLHQTFINETDQINGYLRKSQLQLQEFLLTSFQSQSEALNIESQQLKEVLNGLSQVMTPIISTLRCKMKQIKVAMENSMEIYCNRLAVQVDNFSNNISSQIFQLDHSISHLTSLPDLILEQNQLLKTFINDSDDTRKKVELQSQFPLDRLDRICSLLETNDTWANSLQSPSNNFLQNSISRCCSEISTTLATFIEKVEEKNEKILFSQKAQSEAYTNFQNLLYENVNSTISKLQSIEKPSDLPIATLHEFTESILRVSDQISNNSEKTFSNFTTFLQNVQNSNLAPQISKGISHQLRKFLRKRLMPFLGQHTTVVDAVQDLFSNKLREIGSFFGEKMDEKFHLIISQGEQNVNSLQQLLNTQSGENFC